MRFLAALLLLIPASSMAAPAWQADLTPAASAPFARLAPCQLDYRASWKGLLNAGNIHMEFGNPANAKAGAFVATLNGASTGPAASVYDFKNWYWSELDSATLKPRLFHSIEHLTKRSVTYHLDYSSKGIAWNRKTHINATGVDYDTKDTFAFSPVHDLFSAMLFVRSLKLDNGDDISFVIQPGDSPYLVNIHVEGREAHNGRATIHMNLGMKKIDPATLELLPYKKLKKADLWLSDDADRIPVEIRAAAFIGDVRVTLAGQKRF